MVVRRRHLSGPALVGTAFPGALLGGGEEDLVASLGDRQRVRIRQPAEHGPRGHRAWMFGRRRHGRRRGRHGLY